MVLISERALELACSNSSLFGAILSHFQDVFKHVDACAIGCYKKVIPFEKSQKFDCLTFSKIFFSIPFVNGPKTFGDDKTFVFGT